MRILITGASGFLGSWICRVLAVRGDVCALTRKSSNLRNLSNIPNLRIHQVETNDWPRFIENYQPEVIILNDWSGVENSFRNDVKQFENVERHSKLVNSAKSYGVKTIIGVGSQAELGPVDSQITELVSDNPTSSYGEAKVQNRIALQKQIENTNIQFIWMRIFSTYGPLDEGSWLIPNIVQSLERNEVINLTKGEQEWSYLHAYDLAVAFAAVLNSPFVRGIVNVGNPNTISIKEVALTIGNVLKKQDLLAFGTLDYRQDQVMKMKPVCETLGGLGWVPQISFDSGIKQTIDWLTGKALAPLKTRNNETLHFNLPTRT